MRRSAVYTARDNAQPEFRGTGPGRGRSAVRAFVCSAPSACPMNGVRAGIAALRRGWGYFGSAATYCVSEGFVRMRQRHGVRGSCGRRWRCLPFDHEAPWCVADRSMGFQNSEQAVQPPTCPAQRHQGKARFQCRSGQTDLGTERKLGSSATRHMGDRAQDLVARFLDKEYRERHAAHIHSHQIMQPVSGNAQPGNPRGHQFGNEHAAKRRRYGARVERRAFGDARMTAQLAPVSRDAANMGKCIGFLRGRILGKTCFRLLVVHLVSLPCATSITPHVHPGRHHTDQKRIWVRGAQPQCG